MKLTKGTKPIKLDISENISYIISTTGNYTEITISDPNEITKLKSKGFKQ